MYNYKFVQAQESFWTTQGSSPKINKIQTREFKSTFRLQFFCWKFLDSIEIQIWLSKVPKIYLWFKRTQIISPFLHVFISNALLKSFDCHSSTKFHKSTTSTDFKNTYVNCKITEVKINIFKYIKSSCLTNKHEEYKCARGPPAGAVSAHSMG